MEEQLEKELDKFSGKDLTNQSLETVYKSGLAPALNAQYRNLKVP